MGDFLGGSSPGGKCPAVVFWVGIFWEGIFLESLPSILEVAMYLPSTLIFYKSN